MTLFSHILDLEKEIKLEKQFNQYRGVFSGVITHIKENGEIRVRNNSDSLFVTYWLKPTSFMYHCRELLRPGMVALYCYPTLEIDSGFYFVVINPDLQIKVNNEGGLSTNEVQKLIDQSILTHDASIKSWVVSQGYVTQAWVQAQNYTTLAAVQTWVNSQGFTSLAAVQTWVNSQGFTTLPSVQTWVNNQGFATLTWTANNFLSLSSFNTAQTNRDINILRVPRYMNQLNTYTQGGDYAVPNSWVNRCVTFVVNDTNYPSVAPVTGYNPQVVTGNPTPVEYKNTSFVDTKYRIICNSGTQAVFPVINDSTFIRNASRFRMYVRGDSGSITVNGSSTAEYALNPLTQWRLTRTANNTFTLTDVGYNFVPY